MHITRIRLPNPTGDKYVTLQMKDDNTELKDTMLTRLNSNGCKRTSGQLEIKGRQILVINNQAQRQVKPLTVQYIRNPIMHKVKP